MSQQHENHAWWWKERVLAVTVEEIVGGIDDSTNDPSVRFYLRDEGTANLGVKMTQLKLTSPPEKALQEYLHRTIGAFTEMRQLRWSKQPQSWPAFHAFTILEIDSDGFYILLERKSDKLELMLGKGPAAHNFMKEVRASGEPRNRHRCKAQPRQKVMSNITVHRLLKWLDRLISRRWQPYNLFAANCQHFICDLQKFLIDPMAAELELI